MVEETKALLRQLHDDNVATQKETQRLRTSLDAKARWGRRIIAAAILVAIVLVYAIYRDREFRGCMVVWAQGVTDRTQSLTGPGNARINLFFQAYTEAAGSIDHPLTPNERKDLIRSLDIERRRYTLIPKHPKLETSTDYQLLAYSDLIAALRLNGVYQERLKSHPVPQPPDCGGLF